MDTMSAHGENLYFEGGGGDHHFALIGYLGYQVKIVNLCYLF